MTEPPAAQGVSALVRPSSGWRGSERADWIGAVVIGGLFAVVAVILATTVDAVTPEQGIATALLILVYAVAFRTEYHHPVGGTVPTEPVLIAMLFLVPLHLVPVAVALAQLPFEMLGRSPRRVLVREVFVRLISGWHCIGPVLVLLVAAPPEPSLRHWPIYALALASQFVFDLVPALIREYLHKVDLRQLARPMAWTIGVDTLLAIVGLCAVIAADATLVTIALVCAPIGLFSLLGLDRRQLADSKEHLGQQVEVAREEARIDALTGLGNRRAWYEAVDAAQAVLEVPGSTAIAAVVAADLNDLKYANDILGHEVGDELIKAMAEVTAAVAPGNGAAFRVGGDEFAMLLLGDRSELDADEVVARLRRLIDERGEVSGVQLSAEVGFATCPPAPSVVDAMRIADRAVLTDKYSRHSSRGRSRAADSADPSPTEEPAPR